MGEECYHRVMHSRIKRLFELNEANFMFYSILMSVQYLRISDKQNFRKKLLLAHLRVCPREHQAVVLHVISPISMKLCQFKGSTLRLKQANWFLFWIFPWVDRPLPQFFMVFTKEIGSK